MTCEELFQINIPKPDRNYWKQARAAWDSISKPLDGLGDFETLICQIAAIEGKVIPEISKRELVVFCADNGVVKEGISQSTQEITRQVALCLGQGISSACCLARSVSASVLPVDVGINCEEPIAGVLGKKVALGTEDFLEKPAMTKEQALQAMEIGIEIAKMEAQKGIHILATGEMGIGNTTTTTAVLCELLHLNSDELTGRGAGLDDKKLTRKKEVIMQGMERYSQLFEEAKDEKYRAFEILRCLGGLDIAAMSGLFIGCGIYRIPVVIDGVISAVAALLAEYMVPGVSEYMIPSHCGREQGTKMALQKLGKNAFINGNMALGEGTGALMLFPLMDSALYFFREGLRFEGAGIENYERFQ